MRPFQGALALSNLRRGPFISLTGDGFHEVALGDPLHDDDDTTDDSDSDSDAGPSTSAARRKKKPPAAQKKKRPTNKRGNGGDDDNDNKSGSKRPKAAAAQEGNEEEEEEEKERWVQCDRCRRWRVVPDGDSWDAVERDPRPFWFCEFARWDVRTTVPFEAPCQQR